MRIFVESRYVSGSIDQIVRQSFEILREALVFSARGGGTLHERSFILVDAGEVPKAVSALEKAGVRVRVH
jgi:hypothetical protein